ncbi:MAG: electron transfer flavoprotein subunit alpha [Xanthomonadaceae bacterium]|nr:electron transfer flavoprotein subunit alpha [Xanthomonadaceae bacterium]
MSVSTGPVWVFAEQNEGSVLSVSIELIGQARKLADVLGVPLEVVFLGDAIRDQAEALFAAGADRVYLGEHPELKYYQSELYTEIIVKLAEERQPEIFLLGSTSCGKELAPLVAARLKTGLTAHCIDLVLDGEKRLEQVIPAYGGLISIVCPEKRPQMATVARGVFPKPDTTGHREGELIILEIPELKHQRIQLLEVVHEEVEGVPLDSAAAVVAGGAGAQGPEGWQEITALADELGAALGSTRPPVDEGWVELDKMIGQSGKMIAPELYIGVGVSGELQHMVGIAGAKLMVAVNSEPKAPIFEQVDVGVVDALQDFLPVLIEKIKEYKA